MSNRLTIAALILLTLLVAGTIVYAERVRPSELTLPVHGMVCEGCEEHLQEKLLSTPGVAAVKASHQSQEVRVIVEGWSRPDEAALQAIIKKAGYEPAAAE